jgi:hypothetical protein
MRLIILDGQRMVARELLARNDAPKESLTVDSLQNDLSFIRLLTQGKPKRLRPWNKRLHFFTEYDLLDN